MKTPMLTTALLALAAGAAGQDNAPLSPEGKGTPEAGIPDFSPNPTRPMSGADFVKNFPRIMPKLELPPGLPPARIFASLDANRNRKLDPQEMKNLRRDIHKTVADHKRNMQDAPPRGDGPPKGSPFANGGEIDKELFIQRAKTRSPGEDPHVVFAEADKDGSGGISQSEMRAYYKDTHKKQPPPFGNSAPDGREMPFGEFERRFMSKLRTDEDPHGHHKKFMELDKDGNLRLSKEEMEVFRKEL